MTPSEAVVIGGAGNMAGSKKFRDARRSPDVAVVVDDLASVDPWRPRAIEIRGRAETHTERDAEEGERLNASFPFQPAWIRIAPRRILAWGIDRDSFELTARDVARAPPEPPDLRLGVACPRSGTPRHLR